VTNWTIADIPDQTGRVAVVTGANTGLGFEIAKALAARRSRVLLAVRNVDKGRAAAAAISAAHPSAAVAVQELDLGSLASVRAAAEQLKSTHDHIDLLINNAGLMYPPKATTAEGFELQFGTNHLGHFAFTGLLLDRLIPVPGSRVVTVSSMGHRINAAIHFDDLNWERSYNRYAAYNQSKLANLLFTYELQRRLASHGTTIATASHPGGSHTELTRHLAGGLRQFGLTTDLPSALQQLALPFLRPLMQSAAMGALPTLRAATDPGVLGAEYYGPGGPGGLRGYPKVVPSSDQSHDLSLQRRLWAVSEELTEVVFPVGSAT
jgi:NAD(P)-dependent dehydrogenase (short-subunit alcohol dehydrogenase family)